MCYDDIEWKAKFRKAGPHVVKCMACYGNTVFTSRKFMYCKIQIKLQLNGLIWQHWNTFALLNSMGATNKYVDM